MRRSASTLKAVARGSEASSTTWLPSSKKSPTVALTGSVGPGFTRAGVSCGAGRFRAAFGSGRGAGAGAGDAMGSTAGSGSSSGTSPRGTAGRRTVCPARAGAGAGTTLGASGPATNGASAIVVASTTMGAPAGLYTCGVIVTPVGGAISGRTACRPPRLLSPNHAIWVCPTPTRVRLRPRQGRHTAAPTGRP